ncbi:MAG: MFS transporter [Micrococcales bacterium]|nr:MFS transporter [Micrococcales bacterium]
MAKSQSLRSFNHRNFRVLYPANALSNIGTWAQRVAQDWLVLELTNNDAAMLGLVTAVQFFPSMILSLYGGLLADRFSKRKLLFITNAGAGLASLLLGLLVITESVALWHVFLLAFIVGVFSAVDSPIRISFTSELVGKDDLANAVSLNSANFNAGRLIGPALSGFLIAAYGTGPSFIINTASYLVMLGTLLFIRDKDLHITVKPNKDNKLREAFKYVLSRKDLVLVMLVVFFTTTFGLNFQIFIALMSTKEFGLGPREFGTLGTILAVGSLSGALIAARLEKHRTIRNILRGAFLFGVLIVGSAFLPDAWTYGATLPLLGATVLLTLISANTYVQSNTDSNLRGRVMGIYLMIFMGGTPLGSPLVGFMAAAFGIRGAIVVCGIVVAVAALIIRQLYINFRNNEAV